MEEEVGGREIEEKGDVGERNGEGREVSRREETAEWSWQLGCTFSCSSCRTLAWEWAVVDLNDSLRCSSIVLLCSTNLQVCAQEEWTGS